jgi:5-hmdU DNA kinase, helical domain
VAVPFSYEDKMLNPEQHERFLYWQDERERIRHKKEADDPKPWTTDPILRTYRFCNVRREDDRVTKWINNNIRLRFACFPTLPVMLAIGRWLNEPKALHYLIETKAWPVDDRWSREVFYQTLKEYKDGHRLYNPAYVISPCGTHDKERFVTTVVGQIYSNLNDMSHETLAETYTWFSQFHGWGPFMSYQVLIDLRHTMFLNHAPDRASFAAFGPGTRRGLNRLYDRPLTKNVLPKLLRDEIAELQDKNSIGLEASDICNCLCEFDKYMRALNEEGKPKQLYR